MKFPFNKFTFFILSIVFFVSCGNKEEDLSQNNETKLKVTSTTGMITDALNYIAGDKIELVATICGPGIDPHSYIPTTQDIVNISKSDLIIYNGLNLEAKMGDILSQQGKNKAFAIGTAIPIDSLINNSQKSDILDYDPHVWNDPMLWIYSINMLVDVLAEKDTANADFYRKNGENYILDIKTAYLYAKAKYAEIPKNRRVLISEHDAFQYFAKAYDFDVRSVLGMNTDTEAGVKVLQELSDYVVKNQVKSVFVETIINHKGIQALQNAVNSKKWNLKIAEKPLYSDALGQNPPTNTFIGIIKYNADVINEALK
jgi:manganese/zinc/iron transport system substrate-binding protein